VLTSDRRIDAERAAHLKARDGVPLGLSVGFAEVPGGNRWSADRQRVTRTSAALDHVAVVRVPAYTGPGWSACGGPPAMHAPPRSCLPWSASADDLHPAPPLPGRTPRCQVGQGAEGLTAEDRRRRGCCHGARPGRRLAGVPRDSIYI
jgi:hypothetical protein